jgi:hypothetical protein
MSEDAIMLAIFDTTREPDTNTTQKNMVWVDHNRVRVTLLKSCLAG